MVFREMVDYCYTNIMCISGFNCIVIYLDMLLMSKLSASYDKVQRTNDRYGGEKFRLLLSYWFCLNHKGMSAQCGA